MKLAVIGNWGHFPQVLNEIRDNPEFRIVAFAKGTEAERLDPLPRKFPMGAGAALYDDYRRMLAAHQPDAVIVSTRLDRIADIARDAAHAGAHLFCEKPLALDHASLRSLWDTVGARGVQCFALLNNRSHPLLAAAAEAVREGRIGDVALLNARKSYRFGTRPDWFGERRMYGGTIPWIGIHALDFIDAVSPVPVSSVSAAHANIAHPERPACEDVCALQLQRDDGSLATASLDYLRPDSAETHGDDWLRIVGSNGIIEVAMDRGQATIATTGQPPSDLPPLPSEAYYLPLLHSLADGSPPPPSPATRRSFLLTQIALCARDAADEHAVRSIPDAPWQ